MIHATPEQLQRMSEFSERIADLIKASSDTDDHAIAGVLLGCGIRMLLNMGYSSEQAHATIEQVIQAQESGFGEPLS